MTEWKLQIVQGCNTMIQCTHHTMVYKMQSFKYFKDSLDEIRRICDHHLWKPCADNQASFCSDKKHAAEISVSQLKPWFHVKIKIIFKRISDPGRRHRSTVLFFISGVVPSWNEIKSFKEYQNVSAFYFNTEPRLKWNKIVLAAKIILFHFRCGSTLKYNTKIL